MVRCGLVGSHVWQSWIKSCRIALPEAGLRNRTPTVYIVLVRYGKGEE